VCVWTDESHLSAAHGATPRPFGDAWRTLRNGYFTDSDSCRAAYGLGPPSPGCGCLPRPFTGRSRVHTQVDALTGLETLIAEVVKDMTAQRESIPDPLSERTYSGKLNPRVGEALHRRLANKADEEKLSINQLIVRRLNTAC
jgi:predicted HicB family RNase H-like nuclease